MDLNPEFGTSLSSTDEWCMTNEDKNGIRKAGGFYDLNMEQLEKSFVKRYQYWLIIWRYNKLKLLLEQYLTVPYCTSLYLSLSSARPSTHNRREPGSTISSLGGGNILQQTEFWAVENIKWIQKSDYCFVVWWSDMYKVCFWWPCAWYV